MLIDRKKQAQERIAKISKIAEIVCLIGFFIMVVSMIYTAYLYLIDTAIFDKAIKDDIAIPSIIINDINRTLTYLLITLPDLIALFIFYQAWKLFREYKKGYILTVLAAQKLKSIGWAVFSLGPLAMLIDTSIVYILTITGKANSAAISISIEDTHIYAVILGLLLVTLGRILHEAAIISDEHNSFV